MPKFENFVVIDLNGLTSQSLFTDSLDAIGDLDSHYTICMTDRICRVAHVTSNYSFR